MKEIISKNKCTGCTACANICPKKAITLVDDGDGFNYPVINQEKCINCGLCQKTCPSLNTKKNPSLKKYYAAYSRNVKERVNSSSGGIFSIIANKFLSEGGIVIGAAFDNENRLKHIAVKEESELEKLKGSKYLQSDLNNIFSYIKENIKNKKILFVGTPCQVAGLRAVIKSNENLFCIDVFCHGVPSTKVFEKYIKELENKYGKLENYNFRDKRISWEAYSHTIKLKKKNISKLFDRNDYMLLYLSDVGLRECCYKCNYKIDNKYSDLSLGDFWGVKRNHPEIHNKNGVSAVIINTEKGEKLFNEIKNKIVFKESKIEEMLIDNPSLINSSTYPKNRNAFFKDLDKKSIKELVKEYGLKIPLKRRIITDIKRIIKFVIGK